MLQCLEMQCMIAAAVYLARSANLPIGLCILPSVISSFFYYKQSHLSIYWTDFHDLYTKWKVFA